MDKVRPEDVRNDPKKIFVFLANRFMEKFREWNWERVYSENKSVLYKNAEKIGMARLEFMEMETEHLLMQARRRAHLAKQGSFLQEPHS